MKQIKKALPITTMDNANRKVQAHSPSTIYSIPYFNRGMQIFSRVCAALAIIAAGSFLAKWTVRGACIGIIFICEALKSVLGGLIA